MRLIGSQNVCGQDCDFEVAFLERLFQSRQLVGRAVGMDIGFLLASRNFHAVEPCIGNCSGHFVILQGEQELNKSTVFIAIRCFRRSEKPRRTRSSSGARSGCHRKLTASHLLWRMEHGYLTKSISRKTIDSSAES